MYISHTWLYTWKVIEVVVWQMTKKSLREKSKLIFHTSVNKHIKWLVVRFSDTIRWSNRHSIWSIPRPSNLILLFVSSTGLCSLSPTFSASKVYRFFTLKPICSVVTTWTIHRIALLHMVVTIAPILHTFLSAQVLVNNSQHCWLEPSDGPVSADNR